MSWNFILFPCAGISYASSTEFVKSCEAERTSAPSGQVKCCVKSTRLSICVTMLPQIRREHVRGSKIAVHVTRRHEPARRHGAWTAPPHPPRLRGREGGVPTLYKKVKPYKRYNNNML